MKTGYKFTLNESFELLDCRIGVVAIAWIIGKIKDSIYIYEIEVVEGYFGIWEHTWIKAGDYYLDITLAQFIDCPKIVVSKIGEIDGYRKEKIYNLFDW